MKTVLVIISAIVGAWIICGLPANAGWHENRGYQPPSQQTCHYTGHYDRYGRFHNDSTNCTSNPYPPPSYYHRWHHDHGHYRIPPYHHGVRPQICFDQIGPGWLRQRVCI